MEIIVDGERNFELQGEPQDLLSVIGAVSDFLRGRGRAILSVDIDGKPVSADALGDTVEGLDPAEIKVLSVGSGDLASMVANCLGKLQEVLPELPASCRRLAEIFHGDTPEEGFEPFTELARLWGLVKAREQLVIRTLDVDLDTLSLDGTPVSQVHTELNAFLEEAAQALADGDCILLGDLLEYELAPRAELESGIVALLQECAPAKSG